MSPRVLEPEQAFECGAFSLNKHVRRHGHSSGRQKSGGAGDTASCRGFMGGTPKPCAAAFSLRTNVAVCTDALSRRGFFQQSEPCCARQPKPTYMPPGLEGKSEDAALRYRPGFFGRLEPCAARGLSSVAAPRYAGEGQKLSICEQLAIRRAADKSRQ